MTLAALFVAQATNTHLTLLQQLTIFSVATLTSKGASGVQGASFIALVATCRSFLQFRWREWRSFSASIDS